jgi:hypothetical protein
MGDIIGAGMLLAGAGDAAAPATEAGVAEGDACVLVLPPGAGGWLQPTRLNSTKTNNRTLVIQSNLLMQMKYVSRDYATNEVRKGKGQRRKRAANSVAV